METTESTRQWDQIWMAGYIECGGEISIKKVERGGMSVYTLEVYIPAAPEILEWMQQNFSAAFPPELCTQRASRAWPSSGDAVRV